MNGIGIGLGNVIGNAIPAVVHSIIYLLKATFSQDTAAPLPASLPVDVGGPLTLLDTNGIMSVSGGQFVVNGTNAAHDHLVSPGYARLAGRTFLLRIVDRTTVMNYARFGWGSGSGSGIAGPHILRMDTSARLQATTSAFANVGSLDLAGDVEIACVLRASGAFWLARSTGSGPWTLIWVYSGDTEATLYPKMGYSSTNPFNYRFTNFRVLDLAAFASDDLVYTNRLAAPAAGATTQATADALVEWSFTFSGALVDINIRRQDTNNRWIVRAASDGSLQLLERNAGTNTVRGSAASTFATSTAYRVVLVQEANVYKIYVNNVLKVTYTDPGSFLVNETTVEATSAGLDLLVCWPRTVSLPAGV